MVRRITVKNPIPLIMLLGLAIILAYGLLAPKLTVTLAPPSGPLAPAACAEDQSRQCFVGNCSGVSTCINGAWSGCRWERVCTPGSRSTCLKDGCAYAVKECNGCGTGYGPCLGSNPA
jgi:hypothetical protein